MTACVQQRVENFIESTVEVFKGHKEKKKSTKNVLVKDAKAENGSGLLRLRVLCKLRR